MGALGRCFYGYIFPTGNGCIVSVSKDSLWEKGI